MSDDEKHTQENDSSIYYVLGGVVLVAVVAGFFLLKPKDKKTEPVSPTTTTVSAPQVAPTPGPITKLACEKQYYNPVVGFQKYYVSTEGVDVNTQGEITCETSAIVKDKVVATDTTKAVLVEEPSRGGSTFRCQTKAMELSRGISTKIEVKIENNLKQTATCSQTFIFP